MDLVYLFVKNNSIKEYSNLYYIMISQEVYNYFNIEVAKCGWKNLYYGVFASLINEYNANITAEVGCGYGQHSKELLRDTNVVKHYMIDQYKYYDNDAFSDGIKNIQADLTIEQKFDDFCEMVKNEVTQYGDRVEFIRKTSTDAAKSFNDESLDAIFVDANHAFKYVLEDLYAWWPKVKKGGFMAGDDYWMEDVKRAVHFFETDKGLNVQFKIKEGTNYKIFYFIKQ